MKSRTIVLDFPWDIKPISESISKKFHSPLSKGLPYKTMTNKEILEFPIDDFADESCALFLWVTHTTLPFGLEILKAWGFRYHCVITWDKMEGINCWGFTRNSEFAIFGYRGKMPLRLNGLKNMPTVIRERRTKHSAKPQLFYQKLIHITQEPRIDIFARKRHEGFDAYGDEVEENPPLEAYL